MNRGRSKREKILLLILAGLLGLYLVKLFLLDPYILKRRKIRMETSSIEEKLGSLEESEGEYLRLKGKYEELKKENKLEPMEYLREEDLEEVFQSFVETEGPVYSLRSLRLLERTKDFYYYELEFFGDLDIIEKNLVFIDRKYKNLSFSSKELRRLEDHKDLKNYLVSLEMKLYP